ncbi:glycosyltransferase [Winogradskyella sp. PE311]|uniref:glycosyltransferase n=1 Tax=Winogradskyella sp. PE311 TaxID=3366943 RepID=UPI00397F4E95
MPKTIVHVLDTFPSKSETFIINHIIECERKGFKSIILANKLKPLNEGSQEDLITEYGLNIGAKSYNQKLPKNKILRIFKALILLLQNLSNYKVFFRTLNDKKFGLKSKTLKMWFQAAVFIEYKNCSILHAHFGVNGKLLADMRAIGALKGRIVTSFYGYDTFSTLANRVVLKDYYESVFFASDKLITSSNYLYANLEKFDVPKQKLIVNPVGVDLNRFGYKKRDYKNILNIITVGRLIELKGQHFGIEAIHILLKKGYNINYTIVGDGEEEKSLKEKIIKLELQDNIKIVAGGTQTKVCKLLQNNHVFLMTSITDKTGRAEGQGLVIAEAQATGLPIVAFDSGGVKDTFIHNKTGFLAEEKNTQQIAEFLEKFILNSELINQMGYDAMCFVKEHFNSEKQSEKLIELYN